MNLKLWMWMWSPYIDARNGWYYIVGLYSYYTGPPCKLLIYKLVITFLLLTEKAPPPPPPPLQSTHPQLITRYNGLTIVAKQACKHGLPITS